MHRLNLPYNSKCNQPHGHNYLIEIWVEAHPNKNGMVLDFNKIKKVVNKYDHTNLNLYFKQPTAENIANKIHDELPIKDAKVTVRVWEDRDSYAEVESLRSL